MYYIIGWDFIYTDEHNEEWVWVSGNRMPPPHTCSPLSVCHTFHAVLSCMVIFQFMSLHAVSHRQSYTHAVLHVGITEGRNSVMRIWSVAPHIPHFLCNRWVMG